MLRQTDRHLDSKTHSTMNLLSDRQTDRWMQSTVNGETLLRTITPQSTQEQLNLNTVIIECNGDKKERKATKS